MSVGWSCTSRCEVCGGRPNHRLRNRMIPNSVWRYVCNRCWPEWKEAYMKELTKPKVMYVNQHGEPVDE